MSRHIQDTTSSSCFNSKEPGPDDSTVSNNARSPTRIGKLRKGLPRLRVPSTHHEPRKSPVEVIKVVEMSKAVFRLTRLETLPPLSPEGRHFAIGVREGSFRYADVVGEWLFHLLQDNLPGYEELVGQTKALDARKHINVLRRGDPNEIRAHLGFGTEFEPIDKWSAHEKCKVSKYPTVLGMTGVKNDKGLAQKLKYKEWPQSPDEWTTASSQSSGYDSDEDNSASEDKRLDEMFPHRRYREDF